MLACVQWRQLKASLPAIRGVLLLPDYDPIDDGDIVMTVFRTRILPCAAQLRDEGSAEIRAEIVRLALDLILKQDGPHKEYLINQFRDWFHIDLDWRDSIEVTIENIVGSLP